jgi:hypothetical protein
MAELTTTERAARKVTRTRWDRIDIAVGGISRRLKGLPLDSLLLVRSMVNAAIRGTKAKGARS